MAEQDKPDGLADRIINTAKEDGDISAFQTEINNLPKEERLQLVKDMSDKAIFVGGEGTFLYADGQIDKKTDELVDIDLVKVDYTKDGEKTEKSVKRLDLYTPGETGEKFDKQQELENAVAPYQQLFNLMNVNDLGNRNSLLYSRSDNSPSDYQSRRNDNFYEVSSLLSKHTKGLPERDALMKMFEADKIGDGDPNYRPVVGIDSAMANTTDSQKVPAEVKERIDALIKQNLARKDRERFPGE